MERVCIGGKLPNSCIKVTMEGFAYRIEKLGCYCTDLEAIGGLGRMWLGRLGMLTASLVEMFGKCKQYLGQFPLKDSDKRPHFQAEKPLENRAHP